MQIHITPEQAVRIMEEQPACPRAEELPLSQALDRNLAEDILARLDLPPFDKSPFDGYAFRTADAPGTLRVIGTLAAGAESVPELRPGQAVKIFTGAPVPASADAVAKQEDVQERDGQLTVPFQAVPGTNVIRAGEDCRAGNLLIPAGTRLLPAHLGMIAGQGLAAVKVWQKPKAVLCPTGSELAEPGGPCPPYGIYNSSSFALCGMLTRMGFSAARLPAIPDREELIFETVEKALASDAEVVFTTGGASVGEYDFARRTAERLGAEPLFWKIRMKPGGAILVSRAGSKLLISLSGNPAAAMMSLLVILRPWLTALTGGQDRTELIRLPLKRELPKSGSVLRLLRGHLDLTGGRPCFDEHEGRGNGNIASFAGCDLIGMIPGGRGPLKQGEQIAALRLPPELR